MTTVTKIVTILSGGLMLFASTAYFIYPFLCKYINTCPSQVNIDPIVNTTAAPIFTNTSGLGTPTANFTEKIECDKHVVSINMTYGKYVDSIEVRCNDGSKKFFGGKGGQSFRIFENENGLSNLSVVHGRVIDFIYDNDIPERFSNKSVGKLCDPPGVMKNVYAVYGNFLDYIKGTCVVY